MQVRKFEAKTVKEAIELVKYHLGPDAIILSAKDNSKKFGLMGQTSVEVTAAVSETKLLQKQIAESKLNTQNRQRYQSAPAKTQKKFIDKAMLEDGTEYRSAEQEEKPVPQRTNTKRSVTTAKYIDIGDDGDIEAPVSTVSASTLARVEALASQASGHVPTPRANVPSQEKILSLQNEIQYLKKMLSSFQNVPQNFVTMHPGAEDGLPYELSFVFKKLLDAGVAHENIVPILKLANQTLPNESKKKKAFVDGWVIKYLLDNLKVVEKPLNQKFQVFVGPTGQGKTSTIVKMACHALMNAKKKIAVLSGDFVKVGATDQLKIYCQILNVPCGAIEKWQDWSVVNKTLEKFDHVFIDTPGVNLRTTQDLETLRAVLPPQLTGMAVHYVQSAMARDEDALEVAERFKVIGFNDVIFTRLDEAVRHGIIYNFQKKFDVPIHSFGIGNSVPDDYEFATRERIVDLFFHLSNLKKERGS